MHYDLRNAFICCCYDSRSSDQPGWTERGQGYELNAVAACAIGGTSLAGGKGTVFGTLIGALILGMLDNVLGLKASIQIFS